MTDVIALTLVRLMIWYDQDITAHDICMTNDITNALDKKEYLMIIFLISHSNLML